MSKDNANQFKTPTSLAQTEVANGMDVPYFWKSDGVFSKTGRAKLNILVAIARSLVNPIVNRGGSDEVTLSDANWALQLAATAATGGAGSPAFQFQPQTLHGDYYDAYQVIAGVVSSATTFHILKPPKHRQSWTAEVIDGNNFTYSYSTDNERTATAIISGSPTEDQVSVPRFIVAASDANALTYAVQLDPSAQQTISGVLCDWLEISPDRVWCRKTGT